MRIEGGRIAVEVVEGRTRVERRPDMPDAVVRLAERLETGKPGNAEAALRFVLWHADGVAEIAN